MGRLTQLFMLGLGLPKPPKLHGPLAVNAKMMDVDYILRGKIDGPESLVVEGDDIYTGLYDGRVVHIRDGKIVKEVRFTKQKNCGNFKAEPICGRPLGIRRLNQKELVVADAYLGIYIVDMKAGTFRQIVDSLLPFEGRYMLFINDIEVLNEDEIVFTDSSSEWDRRRVVHIILSHHPTGRLDLETGKMTMFAENLPGLPDNIRNGSDNTLWVGMAGVRHADKLSLIDSAGAHPYIRQLLLDIIPEHWWIDMIHMMRPPHAMIVQLDADGRIIQSMHDTSGKYVKDVSQVNRFSIIFLISHLMKQKKANL
ncbi:unnamed protein product [Nippostrongylus brasiliensis]|uniref:Adipocyte plasma membrane-associated protein (inferred by orthology to a human protein) n=1 Tax=Nippostrongylus brasiliensis TaxID=27835 RepID=A0A0N4XEF7_NIPBR|nr:unnamed protein product [Nippostrongylus brasiliensis]